MKNEQIYKKIKIEGMVCEGCAKRVKNKLNHMDDILNCDVTLQDALVTCKTDVKAESLKQEIESLGFIVTSIETIK